MLKSRWFIGLFMLILGSVIGWLAQAQIADVRRATAGSSAFDAVKLQQDAWNRGDLDAFLSHYAMTDDITFYSDDKVSKGWVGLNDRYRKRYSDPALMGKLEFTELEYTPLSADAVMVRGRWTVTETPNAGTGLFTILIRKTDTGWKVVHDHTSAKKQ